VAVKAVARVWAWSTSQRETTSRAVNCFEDHARHRTHVERIDLNQVARLQHRVLLGFAHRVRAGPQRTARSGNSRARRFHQPAVPLSLRENAGPPWKSKPATVGDAEER